MSVEQSPLHERLQDWADGIGRGPLIVHDVAELRDLLREAARALEAAPKVGEWRPIESVPKDGTMVLCWVAAYRVGEDDDGRHYEADVSECDFGAWRNSKHGGYFDAFASPRADIENPTHWMPLPTPPPSAEQPLHPSGRPYVSKSEMKRVEVLRKSEDYTFNDPRLSNGEQPISEPKAE